MVVCFYEAHLDSTTSLDDENLEITGYNLLRADHVSNMKRGGEGSQIDALISQFGLQQLIKEPTHILRNSSSCIDLIFTSHPNLVMEFWVHPFFHSNCNHRITYAKFNLKIHYPPTYERETWDYQEANTNQIKKTRK